MIWTIDINGKIHHVDALHEQTALHKAADRHIRMTSEPVESPCELAGEAVITSPPIKAPIENGEAIAVQSPVEESIFVRIDDLFLECSESVSEVPPEAVQQAIQEGDPQPIPVQAALSSPTEITLRG